MVNSGIHRDSHLATNTKPWWILNLTINNLNPESGPSASIALYHSLYFRRVQLTTHCLSMPLDLV